MFLRATATVGSLTLISRFLGFARDVLMAIFLGAGPIADAFFVALKLPNLFRRLFAEGAFSVSFVPIFSTELEEKGQKAAADFASHALSLMLYVLIPFSVLMILCMQWVLMIVAPGFLDKPTEYQMATDLGRITFSYLPLISLVALIGGVLNSLGRFAPFAAAPILFNLTLIGALLFGSPYCPSPAHALSIGVTASGVFQLIWMIYFLRKQGFTIKIGKPHIGPRMKKLFRLMGPGALGAGMMQINLFVDVVLASFLTSGAISFLYYADRLNQLPLGVIGIAIGTALLPILSRQLKSEHPERAMHTLNRALEISLLLTLPAALGLMVLAPEIIELLFQHGQFTAEKTPQTAMALQAYAVGLPAYVLAKSLQTAWYARQNTAKPVKIAVITTLCNILLSIILIFPLKHVGIALSTGITAWLQVGLLVHGLKKADALTIDPRLRIATPKIFIAALCMAAVCWGTKYALADYWSASKLFGHIMLCGIYIGLGATIYLALSVALKTAPMAELRNIFNKEQKS